EGYEVFYTPNLDTAEEWTAVEASETSGATPSTQPLAKGATNAYLLPSGPGFYAVSSVTKDHITLESTAIHAAAVPAPTVTKLKPTSGPVGGGTTVTISGTNLTGANAVKFGGTNAASFSVTTVKGVPVITA